MCPLAGYLITAGGDPDALVPGAARRDVLQLLILALLGHVHRVRDAGHGLDGDEAPRASWHVVGRGQRYDGAVIGDRGRRRSRTVRPLTATPARRGSGR